MIMITTMMMTMSSCSYYHASVSSRRRTVAFFHRRLYYHHHHQRLLIKSLQLQPSSSSLIVFRFHNSAAAATSSIKATSPLLSACHSQHESLLPEQENKLNLVEGRDNNKFVHRFPPPSKSLLLLKSDTMFSNLSSRLFNSDLLFFKKINNKSSNLQLIDSAELNSSTCSSPPRAVECESDLCCLPCKSLRKDLKIAPFGIRNLSNTNSNNIPISENLVGRSMPNISHVSCPFGKEGGEREESSWKSFCEVIKLTSTDIDQGEKSSVRERDHYDDRGCRTHFNNNHNDFIKNRKGYLLGKRAMSLSLLLDPIIGSPPSNLTSPIVEARDDISALSEGFTRKVKLLRRRLSTSFDEPNTSSSFEGSGSRALGSGAGAAVVAGNSIANSNVQAEVPFGYKSSGSKSIGEEDKDNSEKKAKLNAWLTQLHEEALCKSQSGSDSAPGDNFKRYSDDGGDGGENSSKPTVHATKIHENLYQLLDKVIGFKGRNISHITVEQSVKDLCTVYMDATEEDKLKFFTILAEKYGVDHEYVTATAVNLASCKDNDVKLTLEEKLRGALVPKSQWLFTQIGRLENGVKFLVDFRTDLLDSIEKAQEKSSLKALNNSLRDLIGMWFNVGFLNLERVTWQSSCDMLQKISEYEAVHPMRNWTDLKKRVGPNRRCFVFTHNSMPGEPVVVLHTFLTDHIPASVQKIVTNQKMRMMSLDSDLPMTSNAEDPDSVSTAAFYSITSTQRGLTGIELGNYLIKRVVRELQSEFPKMTQYSSLSPIPGFKNWLVSSIRNVQKDSTQTLFTEQEINALKPFLQKYGEGKDFYEVFLDLLKVNSWFSNEKLVKQLENPLMRLCAQYLYIVKRRGYALNPVAHFHLKNGAVLWRINWLGDTSPRGLGQSCGMMVNYRYFLDDCETNSQNYMENQVIQISDQVKHLVKLSNANAKF